MKSHTLLEISKVTGIPVNSIRYHMRKLTSQFAHLKRDRYNRFLFTTNDIQKIQNIHALKARGYDYEEIDLHLSNHPLNSLNRSTIKESVQSKHIPSEIEQLVEHQKQAISVLERRLDSLEERLELLIEMHLDKLIGPE